jgi:hypothetical protein
MQKVAEIQLLSNGSGVGKSNFLSAQNIDLTDGENEALSREMSTILNNQKDGAEQNYVTLDKGGDGLASKVNLSRKKVINEYSDLNYLFTYTIAPLLIADQKPVLPFDYIHKLTLMPSGFLPFTRFGLYGATSGTSKQFIAWSGGVVATYQFKPKWGLSTSLGYRNSRLSFIEQEAAFYDLAANGVVIKTADVFIKPNQISYLESSLSINYTLDKFLISSGFRVDRVISALGTRSMIELMQNGAPQLDPTIQPLSNMNEFNLESALFNKWQTNLTAEIGYNLTGDVLLSAGINYRLTRILSNNALRNSVGQQESDGDQNAYLFGQLRLVYNF